MSESRSAPRISPWWFVAVAALVMGTIGTYQFVWSSIRVPLGDRLAAPETALGTVFTVFLVCQAVSQFPAGWVRDRYGPRIPLLVGAPLLAVGYVGTARAGSLETVYAAYALGGIGSGVVYTVAVNTAVKWFTDRRGLATGVVTMSYSGVSFLLIPTVRSSVAASFPRTLTAMGIGVGVVALLAAAVLRDPPRLLADSDDESDTAASEDASTGDDTPADGASADAAATDYEWRETVRTWQFWLLYAVFVVVNGAGLMLIGKVVSYAEHLALPAAVATAGASIVAAADALGIAIIGTISDRLGRERTVAASLVLGGLSLAATVWVGAAAFAWPFAALAGAAALFRSPPFAIFPSLVGDYYGQANSSQNYALLYSAKIPGSVFGGTVASGLVVTIGWSESFLVAAAAMGLAGVAMVFLRPPDE